MHHNALTVRLSSRVNYLIYKIGGRVMHHNALTVRLSCQVDY